MIEMNVIIYCRVSTDDQNVKQQAEYVANWCSKQGYSIVKVVMDEESGRLPLLERKKFRKLLNEMIGTSESIVIYNLDRLTRNWDDVVYIEKVFRDNWDKIKLIRTSDSIDLSNASGRMMFRIKMAVSCYMPEDMREKQIIGIARAKAEGKYIYGRGRPKQ